MGLIPKETVQQVSAANDIVEVINAYGVALKRTGATYKGLCPFHAERSPSFHVSPQRQRYHCFGCGADGDVIKFVQERDRLEFVEAVKRLAERSGIPIQEEEMSPEDEARHSLHKRLISLHSEAADFYHAQLMKMPCGAPAREYLKQRGFTGEIARGWKLGFSPVGDALLAHMKQRGVQIPDLQASGLFYEDEKSGRLLDRFKGRLMFPICKENGEVIGFSGRVLSADQHPAKYVNSPETMIFTKGNVLFGLHKSQDTIRHKDQAIMCEGQIDTIRAFEAGVQNIVASQGTAFTPNQAKLLSKRAKEVILCFDADAAGQKATQSCAPHLLGQGIQLRCMELPKGEDPDTFIRKFGGEAFGELAAKAQDFFEFQSVRMTQTEEYSTTRGKVAAVRKMAELVSCIPDPIARDAVMLKTAMHLRVEPGQFRLLLSKPGEVRQSKADAELEEPVATPVPLDAAQQTLCFLALADAGARAWLQSRNWPRVLEDGTEGAALLARVLGADLNVEEPAAVNAWMAELEKGEELALSKLLAREVPADAREAAQDCWHEMERRDIQRRQSELQAQSRQPGLSLEDQARIHQQLMALRQALAAIPPRRRPPM